MIWKITSEMYFKKINEEIYAKMFVKAWGVDFKAV